jgi:hypothetical protein
MNKHTTANLGKRVHVIMHNGIRFTDRLVGIKSRIYEFENCGKIDVRMIRSFAISKPRTGRTSDVITVPSR